jgi:hypothetical protein
MKVAAVLVALVGHDEHAHEPHQRIRRRQPPATATETRRLAHHDSGHDPAARIASRCGSPSGGRRRSPDDVDRPDEWIAVRREPQIASPAAWIALRRVVDRLPPATWIALKWEM